MTRACLLPLLLSLSFGVAAQPQEPDNPEASVAQSPLIFVEAPTAFEPALDFTRPEIPIPINPEDDPEFIARFDVIRDYNSTVEQIEFSGGAWDQGLVEELATLGVLQQEQGNHEAAIEFFDRAIHVNRINSGLHTLEQIPAVEKLIDSHLALGNWEQADLYYSYLFYIQQKAYGPHDPRIIPVLDRLASWNIQAFNIGYGESLGIRLTTAQILLNAAARMVTVHFGEDDERYISYRRNIANSAYLISRNPELMVETQRLDYRNAADILLEQLDARDSIQPRSFQSGEVALREIVQHYSGDEDQQFELASALADLADWYLMFGLRRASQDLYAQAWRVLEESENGVEWIQTLFGQVTPIPTFVNSIESLLTQPMTTADGKSLNYDYADIVFDVTDNGQARNIRVLSEETAYNSSQFSRLQRVVRDSFFRPKMEDGNPVRSNENYFRYRYWY